MFPGASIPRPRPFRALRGHVVRGLDVAVEFATLGEYGVEEVELEPAGDTGCGWDWPPRCAGRARTPILPRVPRMRGGAAAVCS